MSHQLPDIVRFRLDDGFCGRDFIYAQVAAVRFFAVLDYFQSIGVWLNHLRVNVMKDKHSHEAFFQHGPQLGNQYIDDQCLVSFLAWTLSPDIYKEIEPGLLTLGERVSTDILELSIDAEANPPELIQYDPWGKRIDTIKVSPSWNRLHDIAASEGIVATAYEREQGEFSRLHQFVRLYLFHPSSAMVSCPLAMTDGAARVLEFFAECETTRTAFARLTSRDPDTFWTSGQWMTERRGGSDVSQSETVAYQKNNRFYLCGSKWFTSATTSNMALALAKIEGTDELSLFYLQIRDQQGQLNRIKIHRLKDKLGTRAMPTAELSLENTQAILIGKPGEGIKTVANMLNVTRLYNAVCAVAAMRRGIALALDYANRRMAFGKKLIDQPLHARTLEDLESEFEGGFHLVFYAGLLLGRQETNQASSAERALLRLLTPMAKLVTGKQVVQVTSEVLEGFGGAGYIEDTGLPRLLRDAQVLPIWEGTTNILSLDVLRVLEQPEVLEVFIAQTQQRLNSLESHFLIEQSQSVAVKIKRVKAYLASSANDIETLQSNARKLAFCLAQIYISGLLLEHAQWQQQQPDPGSAKRLHRAAEFWCQKHPEI